jgi:hypothetical protein
VGFITNAQAAAGYLCGGFCVHQCRRSGATSSISVSGIWSRSDQRKVIEDGAFLRETFLACFIRNVGDRLKGKHRVLGGGSILVHDNLLSSLGKQRLSRQGELNRA